MLFVFFTYFCRQSKPNKIFRLSKISFYSSFQPTMAEVNTYLDIRDLNKSIGDLILFENASLGIAERQRVGLIGRNGTGKSTLLNIICGHEGCDSGQIVFRRDIKVGFLEQSPEYSPEQTVLEACFNNGNETTELIRHYMECISTEGQPDLSELSSQMDISEAWDYEHRIKEVLSKLHITNFNEPMAHLSGGQRKRVALANVLLMEPDMLVLDEPTNHLDLQMIEWLEKYLSKPSVTLLMVTHDRYFLDRVCNQIVELDNKQFYAYNGSYSYFIEKRQQRKDAEAAEVARANNLYRRELEWMRRMPQARGHKARYREEAFADLEKLAHKRVEKKEAQLVVKSSYIGSKIIELAYVSKSFGEKKIITDFYYNFSRYEKLGLVGANGTGKSTFIKMLLGLLPCSSGKISVGETVKFGYFAQEGLQFDNEIKVIDVVRNIAETIDLGGGHRLTTMQFLQHFLFPPAVQNSYVYKLSGGERRRLYLCTVLMRNPNFLILDEPTNDLDIETLQVLEEYLKNFKGCAVIASHDRYFMDRVVDHLLVFHGEGKIEDYPGNYTQFREYNEAKEKEINRERKSEQKPGKRTKSIRNDEKRRLTYKERCEMQQLEKEIEQLENEKKELTEALCSGALPIDELTEKSRRLPIIETELDEKSMRWLELSEYE